MLGTTNFANLTLADPIVLDLGAPGLAFASGENSVSFDINADGVVDQMAWTAGEDGILALDADIENGTEIFSPWFNSGSHAGSLAALATLDDNGDGVIDSGDAGGLKSLTNHGITGINLDATSADHTVDSQKLVAEGTFNNADGTTGSVAEVAFETELGAVDATSLADTFVVGPNDALLTIDGYSFAEGDLDLSALLDANFTSESNVADFVQLAQSDDGVVVQVDANGVASGANFVDVVALPGYGASNADIVNAVFAGQEHQLTTTV